jgi:hypothetical protein
MRYTKLKLNGIDGSTEIYVLDPCEDGRWCCQNASSSSSCCNRGRGSFTLRPGTIMFPSTTAPSGQSSTQIVTSTHTVYTSSGSLLPSQCAQDKSALVGASVGATLGTALVASLLALWFVLWRQHKRQPQSQPPFVNVASQVGPAIGPMRDEIYSGQVYEIDGRQVEGNCNSTKGGSGG